MNANIAKLLAGVLAISLVLTACGPAPAQSDVPENTGSEPAATATAEPASGTKVVTDMAGREVEIPVDPQRIYSTSPVGQYFIYAINPDKMAGWCSEPNVAERHFIAEKYVDLPVLGGTFGNKSKLNPEVVMQANPDLIITQGPDKISEATIDDANKLQQQLGIPVIVVGSSARTADKAFAFYGEILNEKERCDELATYTKNVIDTIEADAAKVPEDQKVSIYYAEDEDGLSTDPQKSPHAVVFDMVGCKNVAQVEDAGGFGRVSVSPEQILAWDPDMIVISPSTQGPLFDDETVESLYNTLKSDNKGAWEYLDAVKEGSFYEVPIGPFNWADRPPSVNQILGVQWCGNLVYPEYFDYDMKQVTKEFFALFYHYDLSDAEYDKMMAHSLR